MKLTKHVVGGMLLGLLPVVGAQAAEEATNPSTPVAEDAPDYWTHKVKFGAFFRNIASSHSKESRDETIASTREYINYRLQTDAKLDYEHDRQSMNQTLLLRFGRRKGDERPWVEAGDQIEYDGAWRYAIVDPHFYYGAWGYDSVFTGQKPEKEPLDPSTASVSTGYGQRYQWNTNNGQFESRLGVRTARTWGRDLGDHGREWESGIEVVQRAEDAPENNMSWFIQYEAFSEFGDMGHISHLLRAGLEYRLSVALRAALGFRGYYESAPEDAKPEDIGYDQLSWRQESNIGIVYSF